MAQDISNNLVAVLLVLVVVLSAAGTYHVLSRDSFESAGADVPVGSANVQLSVAGNQPAMQAGGSAAIQLRIAATEE